MALRVWLPLNGTLENKGVSNLTFTNLATANTTVNTGGKIGSCYNNNSFSAGGLCSDTTIDLGTQQSMFCWVNFTSLNSNSNLGGGLISQHRHTANTGMGLTIKYVSSTTGYLSVDTGNGSSRTFNTYCATTLMNAGTWYHVGYTYDGTNIKLYVNGVCEKTQAFTGMSVPANYITVYCWSMSASTGNEVYGNYKLNGKLNDVRVYDHCLSAAEVHEISQGLVLHYKLDSFNNNLFKLNPQGYHPTDYCGYNLGLTINLVKGQQYTVQLWNVTISHSGKTNTQLNLQLYWGGGNNWLVTFANSNFTNGHADYLKATFTAPASPTNATEAQNAWINVYNSPSYASGTLNMHIGAWKIENGSTGTQWSGNDNMAIDSSGYSNNGTITGHLQLNASTSRYSTSTYISSTEKAYVSTPNFSFENMPQGTVNIWINRLSTDSTWRLYTYFSNSYNWTGNTSDFIIIGSTGGQNITLDCCSNTYSFTPDLNKWYMYTITWNLSTHEAKMYVNGELKATKNSTNIDTTYASKHNNHYFGNGHSTMGDYLLSDARIYATSLSAADIKQLYEVGAKVDNLGNWHTFEFTENSSIAKVKKTGVTQANEVHDNLLFRNKAQIIKNNAQILIQGDLNIVTTKSGHIKTGGIPSLPGATVQSLAGKTLRFVYDVCAPGARYSTEQGQTAWSYTRYGIHGSCSLDGSANYPFAGQLNYSGNSFHAIQTWTIPTGKSTYGDLGFSIQNFDKPASTNNDTWFIRNVRLELIEGISEDITGTTLIEF